VRLKQATLVVLMTALSGCNAATVQPQSEPQVTQPSPPANDAMAPVLSAIEHLEGRITATQEQLLNVRSQSARQLEQLQSIQMQLQAVSQELRAKRSSASAARTTGAESDTSDLPELVDQIAQTANDMNRVMQEGNHRVVSCYTRSGQWILIRYDRFTGTSWLADKGEWIELGEAAVPEGSVYEVVLERADNDAKGFVAARLDRNSGQTWWLKQNSWQQLQP
jgi:regulator of replication initiation timing